MIEISRRTWSVTIRTVFFSGGGASDHEGADLIGYVQSAETGAGFQVVRTLHIDLAQDPAHLFSGFGKTTRNEINRASKQDRLSFDAITQPTADDVLTFREFYNAFASAKGTTLCDAYNTRTMMLLIAQQGLAMTKLSDDRGPLCYHVYVVDGRRAMLLYSGSHFRSAQNAADRRRFSRANRFLHWRDILFFKQSAFQIYDCGGLTEDSNIAAFKRSFGGSEITEYTGYVAANWKGRLALRGRALLYRLRYS